MATVCFCLSVPSLNVRIAEVLTLQWCCCRLRDSILPEMGVHLEDRSDGTSICKFMTASEQRQVCLSLLINRLIDLSEYKPCKNIIYILLKCSQLYI